MSEGPDREPMDAQLAAALRELADDPARPSPAIEARVLAAFDRAWAERPPVASRRLSPVWIALAASLVAAIGLSLWIVLPGKVGRVTEGGNRAAAGPVTPSGFITLPEAVALPPLESGQLVRTDLPVSMLPSLGIAPVGAQGKTVKADILVGQDGFARAVRLVNQP